jgi:hypothetical protein
MKTAVTTSIKAFLVSSEILYLTAINKNPHTTAETFLLLAAIKMCEIKHSKNYDQALKAIPLSNNTMI